MEKFRTAWRFRLTLWKARANALLIDTLFILFSLSQNSHNIIVWAVENNLH
jgi:hypothetical protein